MMPFKSAHFYMHKNALDHCIYIQKIELIGHDYIVIKVLHFNLGYTGKPWMMNGPERYKIPSDQYANYVKLSDEDMKKVRNNPGLPK